MCNIDKILGSEFLIIFILLHKLKNNKRIITLFSSMAYSIKLYDTIFSV